ncbi:hypothetical protein H106_04419 [Trichophyton rubrum CBS 735.88]|nr:hypothetical protein H106_04419 [Trichophyton rubrum CBS 735.88]
MRLLCAGFFGVRLLFAVCPDGHLEQLLESRIQNTLACGVPNPTFSPKCQLLCFFCCLRIKHAICVQTDIPVYLTKIQGKLLSSNPYKRQRPVQHSVIWVSLVYISHPGYLHINCSLIKDCKCK